MWWNKVASSKTLSSVLNKVYSTRKGEQIQKLIEHGHPEFSGQPEEQIASQIRNKEAQDPLGARKLYALYKLPTRNSSFADSEYEFIKKRDEARLVKIKKSYQNNEKTFYQAVGEVAADNTTIINSIENTLIGGVLTDTYNKGIVTSEILKIANEIDPDKYKGKSDDIYRKVYKRVDSAFSSFKKFPHNEPVAKEKRIAYFGDRINDSLNLLQGSLELEDSSKSPSKKPAEKLFESLIRINSDQSVDSTRSYTQRVESERRQIFPHIHAK